MNCENCNNAMTQGTYKCNASSYDIVDVSGNVLEVWESHDIPSGNEELGTTSQVYYCSACHLMVM